MISKNIEQSYNGHTDVLTVRLLDVAADFTEDTPSGFIVHYSASARKPVGLEVTRYCLRFGAQRRTLHIDADPPFELQVEAVDCAEKPTPDFSAFDRAMRSLRGGRSMFAR